jgi:hypothetical protein
MKVCTSSSGTALVEVAHKSATAPVHPNTGHSPLSAARRARRGRLGDPRAQRVVSFPHAAPGQDDGVIVGRARPTRTDECGCEHRCSRAKRRSAFLTTTNSEWASTTWACNTTSRPKDGRCWYDHTPFPTTCSVSSERSRSSGGSCTWHFPQSACRPWRSCSAFGLSLRR